MLLAVSCTTSTGDIDAFSMPTTTEPLLSDGPTAIIEVDGQRLQVAVADSSAERGQGLRGVTDLAGLDGMLFVFPQTRVATFTMEDTLIPLDIWFIDVAGVIISTTEMEPCESAPCRLYRSGDEISMALETPRGVFDFNIGDTLTNIASR